jgi:hypothetical protein
MRSYKADHNQVAEKYKFDATFHANRRWASAADSNHLASLWTGFVID